jgi:hypothetical protein
MKMEAICSSKHRLTFNILRGYTPEDRTLHNHLLRTFNSTYLRSWAPPEEPPIVQPLKNFPAFYETRRFITVFTRALRGFLWIFITILFFTVRSCYPTPNPQARGPPLVGCPRLLIQYIRSYPPHLETISSVRNLRTRHAVVTRDPPNMVSNLLKRLYAAA